MIYKFIRKALLAILSFLFPDDNKPIHLNDLSEQDPEKIKYKARIAFVDDEETTHVGRLQVEGYNITQYEDIDNIDEFINSGYDVLILDIQGVGMFLAENTEGWGILKYLKSACPHLVVIIFTGADWSITKYKDLADKADDFIGKDLEYLDFKSKLDSAIKKAFSFTFHYNVFRDSVISEAINPEMLKKLERIVAINRTDRLKGLKAIKELTSKASIHKHADRLLSITSHISQVYSNDK